MNGILEKRAAQDGAANRADTRGARWLARGHGMPCPYAWARRGRGTACRARLRGQAGPGWSAYRLAAAALVLITMVLATGSPGVGAQATPVAPASDVPAPEECQIAPPEFITFPPETMQPIAATPAPIATELEEPFAPPAGEPADAATVTAVTATVREAIACRNAGDYVRILTLFTPNMLAELYGSPATLDPEVLRGIQEGPRPLPEPRRLRLVAIGDIITLSDGRAGAIVETSTPRRDFRDFLYFVFDPEIDRWLIDGSVPLP